MSRTMDRTTLQPDDFLRRVSERLRTLGITERQAGVRAGSPSLLRVIRNGLQRGTQRGINTTSLKRIADALETTPDWLLTGTEESTTPAPPGNPKPERAATSNLPLDSFNKDLPVLGTAAGSIIQGVSGLKLGRAPLGYILRPPRLAGIPNAYAVRVTGRSMEPMLRSGDLCIVDPNETAMPGDTVIVQTQHYDTDPGQTYVKILASRSGARIALRQTNPEATIEIPREYVSSVHRVLTMADVFGD
ncbi:phage repressor protein C with HTH and peptisase S24 domain [Azorhizobium sp. AG788]|nr:phage repressor protein C with HTH and peptisase S24 domain [Azorhizobium sp. AG788]